MLSNNINDPMCSLFLGVRCDFPLKRNTFICLFKQNLKKSYLNNKSPIPKTLAGPSIDIALI
jgi:hypothetical protein